MEPQEALSFIVRPKGYVVVNPTDEQIEIKAAGMAFYVPPKNEYHDPNSKRIMYSYKDPGTGNVIPGTLLLLDIVEQGNLVLKTLWSAERAIIHVFGVDTTTGMPTSDYYLRGLGVVPEGATREAVEAARSQGQLRSLRWRIRTAYDVVNSFQLKNEARKRANLPESIPDRHTATALMVIESQNATEMAELRAEFPILVEQQRAVDQPVGGDDIDSKDLMKAIARNPELMGMLKSAAKEVAAEEKK